jgi:hypothetical protein
LLCRLSFLLKRGCFSSLLLSSADGRSWKPTVERSSDSTLEKMELTGWDRVARLGGREDRLAGDHGELERIWWAGLWFWLGDLQRERERERERGE